MKPEDALFIGDTTYDMEMAQAAKVRSMGVSWDITRRSGRGASRCFHCRRTSRPSAEPAGRLSGEIIGDSRVTEISALLKADGSSRSAFRTWPISRSALRHERTFRSGPFLSKLAPHCRRSRFYRQTCHLAGADTLIGLIALKSGQ